MKHTICFIDDKIPVSQYFDDTDIISGMVIQFLLRNEGTEWGDHVVKGLCERLLNDKENWSVSAFTSPAFYDNYIRDNVYSPEIMIYDWDYNMGAGSDDSESYLLKILESSHTMVFIFSESDNILEINEIVQKQEFYKFRNRLNVVNKGDVDSVESIFSKITEKESQNFSFRYGHEVIYKSNLAINKILSEISQLSVEEFFASIKDCFNDGKYNITNGDFIDVIVPRYKRAMYNIVWDNMSIIKQNEPNIKEVRKVWAYRLYDDTPSSYVAMGDIVKNDEGDFFIVFSSDCHMNRFWKKNGGYISLIPLVKIESDMAKEQLKFIATNSTKITSLTNCQVSMTLLPAVPVGDSILEDFVVLPKSITSVKVEKPEGLQNVSLNYKTLRGFTKVASVLDPFKSPLLQFVMDNISGYGCPDFPEILQEQLLEMIKKARL
ncbi:MAG: hypothetical protein IKB31_10725 [Bacteroidaceae bacterium]|nr:hypothetical protein [Bacteroidaceae bacterium]